MTRTIAIHQPNFFPWLGYFDKIARSDAFVVLDDVQHQKSGSNWTTRVQLLLGGQPRWAGAPVRRPAHGTVRIDELRWDESQPWRDKLLRSIALNYGRCARYEQAMELIEPLVRNPQPEVAAYNLQAVRTIAEALGLRTPMVPASSFGIGHASNERLASLVQAVGGDVYLAGGGAQGYQDAAVFQSRGIRVLAQGFRQRPYAQRGVSAFVPGLSVIDALMNVGVEGTRSLLFEGAA